LKILLKNLFKKSEKNSKKYPKNIDHVEIFGKGDGNNVAQIVYPDQAGKANDESHLDHLGLYTPEILADDWSTVFLVVKY
jgi:hypothetical protein